MPELRDQLLARGLGELRDRLDELLALELDQADDALAAALDVDDRVAVAQQDVGAGGARRAPALGALRPAQRGAVGLGGIGRGEDQVLVLARAAGRAGARPRPASANWAPPRPSTK